MDTKAKVLLVVSVIFVLSGINISQVSAMFMWNQLGRAALMPNVKDQLTLAEKFPFHRWDISQGLKKADASWDAEEITRNLESAIMSGRIVETTLQQGARFSWMICLPRPGAPTVVSNVQWAGSFPLEGFLISVPYGQNEIIFFLAKRCGNLCLVEIRPLPAPLARPVAVERPPVVVEPPPVMLSSPPVVIGGPSVVISLPLPPPPPWFWSYRHHQHGSGYGNYGRHRDRWSQPRPPRSHFPRSSRSHPSRPLRR